MIDITAQPSKATLPVKIRLDWTYLEWPLVAPKFKSALGEIDIQGDLNTMNMAMQAGFVGENVPRYSNQSQGYRHINPTG